MKRKSLCFMLMLILVFTMTFANPLQAAGEDEAYLSFIEISGMVEESPASVSVGCDEKTGTSISVGTIAGFDDGTERTACFSVNEGYIPVVTESSNYTEAAIDLETNTLTIPFYGDSLTQTISLQASTSEEEPPEDEDIPPGDEEPPEDDDSESEIFSVTVTLNLYGNPIASVSANDTLLTCISAGWDGAYYMDYSGYAPASGTLRLQAASGIAFPEAVEGPVAEDVTCTFESRTDNILELAFSDLQSEGYVSQTIEFSEIDCQVIVRITLKYTPDWNSLVKFSMNGNPLSGLTVSEDTATDYFTMYTIHFSSSTVNAQNGNITASAISTDIVFSEIGDVVTESLEDEEEETDDEEFQLTGPVLDSTGKTAVWQYSGLTGTSETVSLGIPLTQQISEEESNTYVLNVEFQTHYEPQSSGGGGGGGSGSTPSVELIHVINEDNPENNTNDTTLFSGHTVEQGNISTTTVSSAETDALIALAEVHKDNMNETEGEHEAVIEVVDTGNEAIDTYVIILKKDDVEKIRPSIIDALAVKTPAGYVRIRKEELLEQGNGVSEDFQVTLKEEEYENRNAVDVDMAVGGRTVSNFSDSYMVEVRIPYVPAEGEDVAALVAVYIAKNGDVFVITESRYDADAKMLCFFVPHLSKYGISYNPKLFSDVKSTHWASSYITFLAARGVVSGTGSGKFQPDAKVSKAEFITMMTNAFSKANLGKKAVKSYKDVKTTDWFARQVGWSYINNLSNMIAKNGYLYPNADLTREDMATLSNNISLGLNLRLKKTGASTNFKDASSISSYAVTGVNRMVSCGIINGAGGKFFPKNGLTRAEAAKVISVLLSSMK